MAIFTMLTAVTDSMMVTFYDSAWLCYGAQLFGQTLLWMFLEKYFVDVINIYNILTYTKWVPSTQLNILRAKTEVSWKRNSALKL